MYIPIASGLQSLRNCRTLAPISSKACSQEMRDQLSPSRFIGYCKRSGEE